MNDGGHGGSRKKPSDPEQLRKEVEELLGRVDSLPDIDPGNDEEILRYERNGFPA